MLKTVRLGSGKYGSVYATIQYTKDGRLSIQGVEGPLANGDAKGSAGQIVMSRPEIQTYAEGWNEARVNHFYNIWERWHLNDMRAGDVAQEEAIRLKKAAEPKWQCNYDEAYRYLTAIGLNPRNEYKYGVKWKTEPVPAHVIEWLESLPSDDTLPTNWCLR